MSALLHLQENAELRRLLSGARSIARDQDQQHQHRLAAAQQQLEGQEQCIQALQVS